MSTGGSKAEMARAAAFEVFSASKNMQKDLGYALNMRIQYSKDDTDIFKIQEQMEKILTSNNFRPEAKIIKAKFEEWKKAYIQMSAENNLRQENTESLAVSSSSLTSSTGSSPAYSTSTSSSPETPRRESVSKHLPSAKATEQRQTHAPILGAARAASYVKIATEQSQDEIKKALKETTKFFEENRGAMALGLASEIYAMRLNKTAPVYVFNSKTAKHYENEDYDKAYKIMAILAQIKKDPTDEQLKIIKEQIKSTYGERILQKIESSKANKLGELMKDLEGKLIKKSKSEENPIDHTHPRSQ